MTGANYNGAINSISLDKKTITLKVGGIAYLSYSTTPNKNVRVTWSYDDSIISISETSNGIVITGKKEGYSPLTVYAEGKSATCIVSVSGTSDYYEDTSEPYIYSNYSIIQLTPGNSEQINVSLYNGTAADIDGYNWTIDNPAICNINSNGQYCTVSAKTEGYARIKVTHSKSAYPYYIGVYVLNDISNVTFITTNQNIVTLNKKDGAKSVKVDISKPTTTNYKTTFKWEVIEGSECISLISSEDEAQITPLKSGVATVRVTNSSAGAEYPLDIMVRVVEIVENVYVDVETVVNITGEETKTITATLNGLKENAQYSNDDFVFEFEDPNQNICVGSQFSNTFSIIGKKNGSTILFVSHPKAEYKRQVLIITEGQLADAVDSSCYITTSQNYIKTKVGAEDTVLNVILKGAEEADKNNFKFTVKNNAKDGSTNPVIKVTTANGTVSVAKSAAQTFAYGSALITPLCEGEAVITVTNPKSYYPLEILVKVLDANTLLSEPLYFTGSGIITFLNSETYKYNLNLSGANKKPGDESNISWQYDNSKISCTSNGSEAVLKSKVTGNNISHLVANHPKVDNEKDILVVTADTEEELASIQAFYANKLYFGVNVGKTTQCYVSTYGYNAETQFSGISWTSESPSVAAVEYDENEPLKGTVTGISPGTAKIKCKYYDSEVTFCVTVYPENYTIDTLEQLAFLSTTQNVVNLPNVGLSKTVKVTATGLTSSEKNNLIWTSSDTSIAKINANGLSGTITAVKEGEAVITVSHPSSSNELKIYVKIGSEYISSVTPVTYIASNTDVIAIVKDSQQFELSAYLVKNKGIVDNSYGFGFSIANDEIATITPLATGKCYVKPENAGQTEITITHNDAEYDKKILVVVGNTEEELAAFRYITTTQNVVSVGQGSSKSLSVSMMNTSETVVSGYKFESENPVYASILSQSGSTCVIKGNEIGTTRIKVTNDKCSYPLYIIVQVVDPIAAASCPYIQVTQPVLNLIESTTWTTVTGELVGGSPDDQKGILWTSSDNTILEAYGQNGVGKVRAKTSGICYLTVSHPKAPYEQRILCICDKAASRDYSISLSSPNILSIKPNAGDQAITATLVNGTNADKNNFNWSLDVYNIVSLTYSGNQAVITPLQEGTCTLTVSHPKSPYDQKIVIKVQSYDSFNFASTNKTIVAGTTNFINMQVPASSVKTHIVYSTSNEKICTISGTSSVAQLTGIASGTCTVKAQLIATATNVVQAESDMLVYVSPADSDAVYISGSPTVYTIEMGEQKTLSAIVTGNGITTADYYNLKWKSNNPDIVEILGASTTGVVMGSQVYAIGKKPGEALITISHEKTNTELIYYVIVPGTESSKITLNKSFITVNKSETTTLKATITGGSTSDYQNIIWTAEKNDGVEICRVMGYGQEVTIYGINSGTTDVIATLPNGSTTKCQVVVESTKEVRFDFTTLRIQPGQTKTIKYHVTPATAGLTWVQTDDSYFTYVDKGLTNSAEGEGTLEVTGIKTGSSSLKVASSYGNTATLQIQCTWDYNFTVDRTSILGTPDDEIEINYSVTPANSKIDFEECDFAVLNQYQEPDGSGKLIVKPKKEGSGTINLNAVNINISNTSIFKTIPIKLDFKYKLDLLPVIVEKDGKFSSIDSEKNVLISDGENVYLSVDAIPEQRDKADYIIDSITYVPFNDKKDEITAEEVSNTPSGYDTASLLQLSGGEDIIDQEYKFSHTIESINGNQWADIEAEGWEEYSPNYFEYYQEYISLTNSYYSSTGGGVSYLVDCYYFRSDGISTLLDYRNQGYKIYRSKAKFGIGVSERKQYYDRSFNVSQSSGGSYHHEDADFRRVSSSFSRHGGKRPIGDFSVGRGTYAVWGDVFGSQDFTIYYFKAVKPLSNGDSDIIYLYGNTTRIEDPSISIQPTYRVLTEPEYHSISESEANALLKMNPYKVFVNVLDDTAEAEPVGIIKVQYYHLNKKEQPVQFVVYKEKRKCSKDQIR